MSDDQQRLVALGLANRIRSDAGEIRREIIRGDMNVFDALDDPRAGSLTIERLLAAQKRWGPQRVHRALVSLRWRFDGDEWSTIVWPDMRVRDLTERQKTALKEFLEGWTS